MLITVYSDKGGVAKTTTAINLVGAAIADGIKPSSILLIDGDASQFAHRWAQRRKEKLNELSIASLALRPEDSPSAAGIDIAKLKERIELIIVDPAARLNRVAKEFLCHSDICITPIQPNRGEVESLPIIAESFDAISKINSKCINKTFLTRVPVLNQASKVLDFKSVLERHGIEHTNTYLSELESYNAERLRGGTVFECKSLKSAKRGQKEISDLWSEIRTTLK
ncbi:TPA: hypothetical protein ACF35N_004506 [Vibrio parahaemolyticus]